MLNVEQGERKNIRVIEKIESATPTYLKTAIKKTAITERDVGTPGVDMTALRGASQTTLNG